MSRGTGKLKRAAFWVVVMLVALIIAGCGTIRSTQEVVKQHHAKVGTKVKDVEDIIADYADDAIFIMPDKTLKGKEAIRAAFTEFFKGFPNLSFTESKIIIEGDMVLVMWNGESDVGTIPYAVDTFIVRNDKIQRQTCRLAFVPK